MSDEIEVTVETQDSIAVTVTESIAVVVEVSEQGLSGVVLAGEVMSAGIIGVSIPVTGFALTTEYQVFLCYAGDPQGNGVLWCEKSADHFLIKHYGDCFVTVSYTVSATDGA